MHPLKQVKRVVDILVNLFMVVTFIFIFCVVLAQIYYRYILGSPLVWSEELSRYVFIWVSLIGWVLAARSNTHIRITFIEERLPAPIRKFLSILFGLVTLAFLAILAYVGYDMAARTMGRAAVTLPGITMGMVYAALPVSAVLSMFYVVYHYLAPAASPSAQQ